MKTGACECEVSEEGLFFLIKWSIADIYHEVSHIGGPSNIDPKVLNWILNQPKREQETPYSPPTAIHLCLVPPNPQELPFTAMLQLL